MLLALSLSFKSGDCHFFFFLMNENLNNYLRESGGGEILRCKLSSDCLPETESLMEPLSAMTIVVSLNRERYY